VQRHFQCLCQFLEAIVQRLNYPRLSWEGMAGSGLETLRNA
jgi:hypothetical protein